MVFAGVLDWPIVYVTALILVLASRAVLYRHNRRAGTAAFRVVMWSLAAGLGIGSAYMLIVDTSGFSYGGLDALLAASALASVPAFVIVTLVVVALRVIFNRGFEALERIPTIGVAIAIFLAGAAFAFATYL